MLIQELEPESETGQECECVCKREKERRKWREREKFSLGSMLCRLSRTQSTENGSTVLLPL